jgi:exodeoxyribonuclease VII large subunit
MPDPSTPPTSAAPPQIFRLAAVTSRIRDLLLEVTVRRFWLRAQLVARGPARSGHFYGELLDIDDDGQTVAKMNAIIWKSTLLGIRRKLELAGCPELLAGNRDICALCSVAYHEVHGLSLQIHDVDPSFGEAHIDRNRRLILERLLAEGLLRKNAGLPLPTAPLRIGLVTAADSAAFNDFRRTLADSPYAFRIVLATATVQGPALESEVTAALQALSKADVDLVAIVRGGGSPVDLAWFDNEKVARAIASMPAPVWVGIGHEIDVGVCDHVAHTAFKTPTAVAEAILHRIRGLDDRLATAAERLADLVRRPLDLAARSLDLHARRLGEARGLDRRIVRLEGLRGRFRETRYRHALDEAMARLDAVRGRLEALRPERVLRRGYSISRDESGRVVTAVASLSPGVTLVTEFADGAATSTVREITQEGTTHDGKATEV